ncbi:MAG TPA: hypothetical protein VE967_04400 [Gemmatimonadaceae bacterium]|nr:hypothetical protein [Gemmatimonadaceae bacterium]
MSDKNNTPPDGTGAVGSAPSTTGPSTPAPGTPGGGTTLPRRSPGHRGQDQRDTVAEMIQKAHEISLEAGSKMATVMKDVIFAAAGLTPFAAESARDLVNYMVRRGQMGAEEAERIRRDIEAAAEKRGGSLKPVAKSVLRDEPKPVSPFARPTPSVSTPAIPPRPALEQKKAAAPAKPAPKAAAAKKPAPAKKPAAKKATKKK